MNLEEAQDQANEQGTERIEKFRTTVKRFIKGIALLCVLILAAYWLVSFAQWVNTPSVATAPASVVRQQHVVTQQPAANPCTGAGESKVIGTSWVAINPDFRCHIIIEVAAGTALLGESNNYVEVSSGDSLGNVLRSKGVRIIYAKAKSGTIRLNYMLHRHGCVEDGWTCK